MENEENPTDIGTRPDNIAPDEEFFTAFDVIRAIKTGSLT